MKKFDFKKLALLGITGGMMLSGQQVYADQNVSDSDQLQYILAGNGCGQNGCGGGTPPSGYPTNSGQRYNPGNTAYRDTNQNIQSNPRYFNRSNRNNNNNNNNNNNSSYQSTSSYNPSGSTQNYRGSNPTGYNPGSPNYNPGAQNYRGQQDPTGYNPNAVHGQPQNYSNWGRNDYSDPSQMSDPHPRYYIHNEGNDPHNSHGNSLNTQPKNNPTADTGKNASATMQNRNSQKHIMTEAELKSQLNAQGKQQFDSLDAEGKALALKLANQTCKGENDCKGLNSCKTKTNDCAGKGGCKGTSSGAFKDKNAAIKVAAAKMAEKRSNLNKR